MAWHWTGDKPLSEPMMTQFNDTYMRHLVSWIKSSTKCTAGQTICIIHGIFYNNFVTRCTYLGHGQVIASLMILWGVISYPCSRFLGKYACNIGACFTCADHKLYHVTRSLFHWIFFIMTTTVPLLFRSHLKWRSICCVFILCCSVNPFVFFALFTCKSLFIISSAGNGAKVYLLRTLILTWFN